MTSTSNSSVGTIPNGTNASSCAKMTAYFDTTRGAHGIATSGPKSLTSRKGVRLVIRGIVRNCKGQAIKNAKLDQVHLLGGRKLIKTGLRTRSDGRFTLITPNNLTSRQIILNYRPFLDSSTVSASAAVTAHITSH